jgi:NADPH-dependent glutamate synthase beta subunit-like oxidoreductase/predicted oxidoreductase
MDRKSISPVKEMKADLVIIGTGGGGMAAAVAAAESGVKDIIVLEKLRSIGGNTAMSAGLFGIDSPVQKRAAQEFNKEDFFKLAMEWAHWRINPRIVRALIEKSGDTIGWLERKGLKFELTPLMPNQPVETWHTNPLRGAGMIKALAEDCRKMGVKVFTNSPAKRLVVKGGRVEGVIAERKGSELKINARAVIIASGGYGGDKDLLRKYCLYYKENMNCDGLHHMGDGLKMAMDIGAATEGLGHLLMSGPQVSGIMRLNMGMDPKNTWPVLMMALALEPNTVWVNKRGERFMDEGTGFNHYVSSNGVNQQPDNICYTLFDQEIMEKMTREGMIIGLGFTRTLQRTSLPGLERELKLQDKGLISIEQVDQAICNGCSVCTGMCPTAAVDLDTKSNPDYSPCRFACPAGVDMRSYFYLFKMGKMAEAVKTLRESMPLPAVTGRVCPHFCETECSRNDVDDAVNINAIERYIADYSLNEKAKPVPRKYKKKVAVVGSGPAGLSAAYFLTRLGYPVTVFEQQRETGGMLRMGIPEYRLPKDVLDSQVQYIADMGVEFKTGVTVGKDISVDKLQKDYQAVFFATGNQLSRKIDLEGSNKKDVLWGLDFLKQANLTGNVKVGKRVLVVGGGNVAVDVALTALRMGAGQVQLACLEKGKEIPAYKEEIEQAVSEGVKINEGWGPARVLGNGKVTGIELMKCNSVYDKAGKFNPVYDKKTTKTIEADMVILAVGQSPDLSLAPKALKLNGTAVRADGVTLETSMEGVFAGGDIVSPAGSVVGSIASGKRAADSIDRYLRGVDMRKGRTAEPAKVQKPPKEGMPSIARNKTPFRKISKMPGNFDEVKLTFEDEMANIEVTRCMTCGSRAEIKIESNCVMCRACELNCPQHAVGPRLVKHVEPLVKIAKTWDEMAKWMSCKPSVLKQTIEEYNSFCDHGRDPIFGKRNELLLPLRTPPFYAVKGNSDFLDTIGGIKVNEKMEVLNKEDNSIPGLFAAGVITGGWESESYCSPLSGEASGFSVNSGRIAGESAARMINGPQKKIGQRRRPAHSD